MTATPSSERLHALDAVRGFALTLGVVFHGAMSYLPGPQFWMAEDTEQSATLGVMFLVLHIFRMTLFFVIAGFFGRMLFQKRGEMGFIRDRAKRIALPLVGFWPLVMAGFIAASVVAWGLNHPGVAPPKPPRMPSAGGIPFPFTHLWFLYLLLWFYAGAVILRRLAGLVDPNGALRSRLDGVFSLALVRNPLSPALLMIPFVATAWTAPMWMMSFGIPTPDSNLLPNNVALASYGTAFGFGWLLQRQMGLLQVFARRWALNLTVAVALSGACLSIAGFQPVLKPAAHDAESLIFALCYGGATWTWTFGLLGAALRFLTRERPAVRYIADASYWIYIVHIPIVIVLQGVASAVHLPWQIEFPAMLAAAFAVMIPSYHVLVRYTWLGAILNGRRMERPARAPKARLQEA